LALLEEREETENAEPPEATPAQLAVLTKIFKLSLDNFAKSENYVPKLTAAFPKPKNSEVGPVPELNDYMKAGLLPKQDKDFSPDWENELRSTQSFVLHTAYALGKLTTCEFTKLLAGEGFVLSVDAEYSVLYGF
jgi:hypothetical protein